MIVSLFSQDWSLPARRIPSSPSGSFAKERQAKGEVNMETMLFPGTPLLLYTGSAFMFMCIRNGESSQDQWCHNSCQLPASYCSQKYHCVSLFHPATYTKYPLWLQLLDLILILGFLWYCKRVEIMEANLQFTDFKLTLNRLLIVICTWVFTVVMFVLVNALVVFPIVALLADKSLVTVNSIWFISLMLSISSPFSDTYIMRSLPY